MLIGYARVSKTDGSQSLDLQRDALRAEGGDAVNVYYDFASGVRDDRPGLDSCLRALRKGDVFVVWKLDRLGRNLARFRRGRRLQAADGGRAAADQAPNVGPVANRVGLRAADGDDDFRRRRRARLSAQRRAAHLAAAQRPVEEQRDDRDVDQAAALRPSRRARGRGRCDATGGRWRARRRRPARRSPTSGRSRCRCPSSGPASVRAIVGSVETQSVGGRNRPVPAKPATEPAVKPPASNTAPYPGTCPYATPITTTTAHATRAAGLRGGRGAPVGRWRRMNRPAAKPPTKPAVKPPQAIAQKSPRKVGCPFSSPPAVLGPRDVSGHLGTARPRVARQIGNAATFFQSESSLYSSA